jgi:hypothetical protein
MTQRPQLGCSAGPDKRTPEQGKLFRLDNKKEDEATTHNLEEQRTM